MMTDRAAIWWYFVFWANLVHSAVFGAVASFLWAPEAIASFDKLALYPWRQLGPVTATALWLYVNIEWCYCALVVINVASLYLLWRLKRQYTTYQPAWVFVVFALFLIAMQVASTNYLVVIGPIFTPAATYVVPPGMANDVALTGLWLSVPCLLLLITMLWWRRFSQPGCCPVCNYDLRATPNRCPECGHQVLTGQAAVPAPAFGHRAMTRNIAILLIAGLTCTVLVVVLVAISSGQRTARDELRTVTFQLDRQAEPLFVGIYLAKERLAEQGIHLNIVEGSGAISAARTVGAGRSAWIGSSNAPATAIARSRGAPVKSLAVLYPATNTVIYSLESRPVLRPHDLEDKTIGFVPGSPAVAEYVALLEISGLNQSRVGEIAARSDSALLFSGQADALMADGEGIPVALRSYGHPIVTMSLSEYGVRMYAMNIIVNDAAADNEAETIYIIRNAILAAYERVRSDPEKAADYFLTLFPERDPRYVRESLKLVASYLGNDEIGEQTHEGWSHTISLLGQAGLLGERAVDPDSLIVSAQRSTPANGPTR